jgi:hypothetical protein
MGGEPLEFLTPTSEAVAADELEFTWTGELETNESFVLRVRDEEGVALLDLPLPEARWSPAPELVESWPQLVHVQVAVVDAFDPGTESRHSEWKRVKLEQ